MTHSSFRNCIFMGLVYEILYSISVEVVSSGNLLADCSVREDSVASIGRDTSSKIKCLLDKLDSLLGLRDACVTDDLEGTFDCSGFKDLFLEEYPSSRARLEKFIRGYVNNDTREQAHLQTIEDVNIHNANGRIDAKILAVFKADLNKWLTLEQITQGVYHNVFPEKKQYIMRKLKALAQRNVVISELASYTHNGRQKHGFVYQLLSRVSENNEIKETSKAPNSSLPISLPPDAKDATKDATEAATGSENNVNIMTLLKGDTNHG